MMTSILIELAFLIASGGNSAGQKGGQFPSITQKEVYLNRGNDGQQVFAKVGQPIVVTLQAIGGGHYGTAALIFTRSPIRECHGRTPHNSRTQAARSGCTVSRPLPRKKPRFEFRTQTQIPR